MKVTIIIPSLNPDDKLIAVIDSLLAKGFQDILLVNDGSDMNHMEPFAYAKSKGLAVLNHEVNRGKGRGLKTAFEWCIANRPDIDGVITVDGDNQHRADDIENCGRRMVELGGNSVILGCRNFGGADVPKKSRIGNHITSWVFKFACGIKISDTQTGLRAIPARYLADMVQIKGERFEYETNMLLEMKRLDIPFEEVEIQTVYIEENASTHFHPIRDSFKIYAVILKFLCSSLAASVIDLGLYTLFSFLLGGLWNNSAVICTATAGARVISSAFNYTVNRKAVFKSNKPMKGTIVRYYVLCVCQMLVSYGLVYGISSLFGLEGALTVIVKLPVDIVLFMISFRIQRAWVF